MYTSFLNHYYLANVHQAIALDQTRKQLTSIYANDHSIDEPVAKAVSEVTTLSELDRVWLRHLREDANQQ